MTELNENWEGLARDNLSKLLQSVPSQQQVADSADVSKSTVNRDLQSALENNLFKYIAICGLKLVDSDAPVVDPEEYEALKLLAKNYLEAK